MGQIIGGIVVMAFLSWVIDAILMKHIVADRVPAICLSAALAIPLGVGIYGFGNADGGPWNGYPVILPYTLGAVGAALIRIWAHSRRQARREDRA
jgi:hypothetical protein